MVKLKRRYVLVEIILEDNNGQITETDLYHAIYEQIAIQHGDYGIGAIKSSFQVKVCDSATNIAVLRISDNGSKILVSSLPFLLHINACSCTLRMVFEGSSMRTVERYLIKQNLASLYARIRSETLPNEKAKIQEAIIKVTGSRVAHIKM